METATVRTRPAQKLPTGVNGETSERTVQTGRNEQADRREVTEAIGHLLRANLHDADHRHECAEIPGPSHQQVRMVPPPDDRADAYRRQRRGRRQDGRPTQLTSGMRVEEGQIVRKESLTEIRHVSHRGVGQANPQRQHRKIVGRPTPGSRDDSDRGKCG